MGKEIAPSKLEIHYFLNDNSHAMNAFIYNECEHDLLTIIKEIQSLLSLNLDSIQVEAILEGGLKSRLIVILKNPTLHGFVLGILSTIITSYLSEDSELKILEKEKIKLEIRKLRKDLKIDEANDTLHVKIIDLINSDIKVAKIKSNYYSSLLKEIKVSKVTTAVLDDQNKIIGAENTVERKNFGHFVLNNDDLESIYNENATIEIVAPVLKGNRIKWKGIYNGLKLSFEMKDLHFVDQILREEVIFRKSAYIECLLEIKRKINNLGEVTIDGYNVLIVFKSFDSTYSFTTPQGIEYKKNKI